MKIDIQKAYNTISWEFLEEMTKALLFPSKIIKLIMISVTTPHLYFDADWSSY